MRTTGFSRRIFTLGSFFASIGAILRHREALRAAGRDGRVDKRFAEKIMLAVTQVNGCRYCNYGHTRAALKAGVTDAELQRLLAGEVGAFPEREAVALAFAQHYAEQAGHPDPEAWGRVVDYYGPDTARDIMAYIRMISFGNLFGNTFDAFLSRLAGKPAAGSSPLGELAIIGLGIGAPVAVAGTAVGLTAWGLGRVFRPRVDKG
ncbi:MAG: carboxymuconolactone decarboxylase family protein [Chloroflexota bacterium]